MNKLWRTCGAARRQFAIAFIALTTLLIACSESSREPEPVGGPALLRRLTESQYRATVADIFGADVPVVARFSPPLRAEGLAAVGTSEAGLTPFNIEQYDAAAMGVADYILDEARRQHYVDCAPAVIAEFDADCAQRFISDYGQRLFRRPLTSSQIQRYTHSARQGTEQLGDFYAGLKYGLVGLMTAPEFLLRIERVVTDSGNKGKSHLDAYSKAARLSYFLTNSTPDEALLAAAASGELNTANGLANQVDRLIASPRFADTVRAFFEDMLEFDHFSEVAKDATIYPAFNSSVAEDAQEQTLRTINWHLLEQNGDYRDLFVLKDTFLTRPLGIIYRQPVPTRNGWEQSRFTDDSDRAGIQSHIAFLALHAHPGRSSPTLRGMAIREVFLCQEVPDPPADIDFSVVQDASPESMPTARDRLGAHNTQAACSGCHKIMDPPGLALENFDGIGTYRSLENGAVIDVSGDLDGLVFGTAGEYSQALRDHPETPRCLTEKLYRYAVGRDTVWAEREYMDYLIAQFAEHDYRVPALMRSIALSKNFFTISDTADVAAHH